MTGMKIAIVGCGAIGGEVARAASAMDGIEEVHLFDIDPDATRHLAKLPKVKLAASASEAVAKARLLIECANKGVVQTAVREALQQGKGAMLLTVGALSDDALRHELLALAQKTGGKLYIPSGAVMGVDGVKAAAVGDLKSVTLVTTKPPAGLAKESDRWTLLFSGSAREAIEKFPKNVNVAATLSLAGLGFDKTHVQVAMDPLATRNSHKLIIEGNFGRARIEVGNLPSPTNPATSYMASLSAIALLRRIVSPIEIGA
jgi:aspartate dehydrogenase